MRKKSRADAALVRVSITGGPFAGADRGTVMRRAQKMLRHLELSACELSVALVDDATMRRLNAQFRNRDRPTDVLAFAMREGGAMPSLEVEQLGDVVISVDSARRQARAQGGPLLAELTMLLAHGLLHLLGHDHRTAAEDRAMRARTDELVSAARTRAT
jgi:probable rRNA maturation factor